jgi:hypothetical protein
MIRLQLFDAFFRRGKVTYHALVSLSCHRRSGSSTGIADDAKTGAIRVCFEKEPAWSPEKFDISKDAALVIQADSRPIPAGQPLTPAIDRHSRRKGFTLLRSKGI